MWSIRWARIEADGVVRACEEDAPRPGLARGFPQIDAADDVGVEDGGPVGLKRLPAQVDHGIHALQEPVNGCGVGEITAHRLLARTRNFQGLDVREPKRRIAALEMAPQHAPEGTSGTGDQHAFDRHGDVCLARSPGRRQTIGRASSMLGA